MVNRLMLRRIQMLLTALILAACAETTTGSTSSPSLPEATETGVAVSPAATESIETGSGLSAATEPVFLPTVPKDEEIPPATATSPATNVTTFPDPNGYVWQEVGTGLDQPLGIVNAGDGSGRLFIVERPGIIRVLQNGNVIDPPLLDIQDKVGSRSTEQGLLGLDFHPRFQENGYFYVNYTDLNGNTVIARFQVTPASSNQADPQRETVLLQVQQPYSNHNGGSVVFGPDGFLYLGLGDGGSGGDPEGNAQSLDTHLGKLLRLDVDGGDPYGIPADNPFVSGGGRPEIWAYGLRNPWRFSFDSLTRDLYVADVGQNQWEEINFLPAGSPGGANFGWDYLEGTHPFEGTPPADLVLVTPVAEYDHSQGCSVTGGIVVRDPNLAEWSGIYLYGDYCAGRVWGLLRNAAGSWEQRGLFEGLGNVSSFGEGEQGEMYLADINGTVYQLSHK